MTSLIWLSTIFRVLTTALLVVTASVLAETAGPFWAALIASLPVSVGPAYVFLAFEHDRHFIAMSALSSFVGNAATGAFLIAYASLAGRTARWPRLTIAILVWLGITWLLHLTTWRPITALLLNLAVYVAGFTGLHAKGGTPPQGLRAAKRRSFDLPARGIAVGLFVALIAGASEKLGPIATGMAAVFPVSLISLFVILSLRIGDTMCAVVATEALPLMLGYGMMLLSVHLTVQTWGVELAFGMALLVFASWSTALLAMRRRRARTR